MSTQRPCVIYFACEFDKDMQTELCDKAQIFSALSTIQPVILTDSSQREINYIHTNMDLETTGYLHFLSSSSLLSGPS